MFTVLSIIAWLIAAPLLLYNYKSRHMTTANRVGALFGMIASVLTFVTLLAYFVMFAKWAWVTLP